MLVARDDGGEPVERVHVDRLCRASAVGRGRIRLLTQTVTPYLLYEDVEAAAQFLTRAFGFREIDRTTGAAGGMHLELEVGPDGSSVYVGQPPAGFQGPAKVGGTSLVYVLVDEVDAHHERAKAAGAVIVEELVDTPFGHRRYTCGDPQGHEWVFATVVAE